MEGGDISNNKREKSGSHGAHKLHTEWVELEDQDIN